MSVWNFEPFVSISQWSCCFLLCIMLMFLFLSLSLFLSISFTQYLVRFGSFFLTFSLPFGSYGWWVTWLRFWYSETENKKDTPPVGLFRFRPERNDAKVSQLFLRKITTNRSFDASYFFIARLCSSEPTRGQRWKTFRFVCLWYFNLMHSSISLNR